LLGSVNYINAAPAAKLPNAVFAKLIEPP